MRDALELSHTVKNHTLWQCIGSTAATPSNVAL